MQNRRLDTDFSFMWPSDKSHQQTDGTHTNPYHNDRRSICGPFDITIHEWRRRTQEASALSNEDKAKPNDDTTYDYKRNR